MTGKRPAFSELYGKYEREGAPRWIYVIYFLLVLAAAVLIYFKAPPCWRPGASCAGCSDQARPEKPEPPRIIRVF